MGINFIKVLNSRIHYLITDSSVNTYLIYSGKIIFSLAILIKI